MARKTLQELGYVDRPFAYPPHTVQTLVTGDRVCYTKAWLRNVGCGPTSEQAHRVGSVLGNNGTFLQVHWDGDAEPTYVNPANLGRRTLDPRSFD